MGRARGGALALLPTTTATAVSVLRYERRLVFMAPWCGRRHPDGQPRTCRRLGRGSVAPPAPPSHPARHRGGQDPCSVACPPPQRVITKCWEDEAFKERLLADPAATLAAEGVQVPEGIAINVAIDSKDVRTLVIPLPRTVELSDAALATVADGVPVRKGCTYVCGASFDVWGVG